MVDSLTAIVLPCCAPALCRAAQVAKAEAFVKQSWNELHKREVLPDGLPLPTVRCAPVEKVGVGQGGWGTGAGAMRGGQVHDGPGTLLTCLDRRAAWW